ncbi:hypothetical protein C8J55DRAFT_508135 [Lentinula edodes]|uniref:Serum paraoxonase/arylesterase n=1 Tax=Lentinula lateritia TaxID=40482 RepID=A0A9W9AP98_9AGAR|nr:hypothetical protein C8J55DRAFT_508135 [Lentinula edodes]
MARLLFTILGLLVAFLAALYQIYLSPLLQVLGVFRTVENFGLDPAACRGLPEFQACEKIVLHQPTGILYLACSTPESRLAWTPAMGQLNAQNRSVEDYIATFDPTTSKITRLELQNYHSDQPISVHGMDVVPSSTNPNVLFVYLVNHRAPPREQDSEIVGADSVIEVFKTTVSGAQLVHIKTVRDSNVILTPNDVAGDANGKGFYFTNDHSFKVSHVRTLRSVFSSTTSVGYCHLDHGCKIVASGLHSNNGIVKAPELNASVYVASNMGGKISVFERQAVDDSLILMDVIHIGQALDNLSLDHHGHLWAAAFPKAQDMVEHLTKNPLHLSPVAAFKISVNTGPGSFYGEKYAVEKIFENDGTIVSGSTSVVHDSERGMLFMHGVAAHQLVVCRVQY